MMELNFFGLVLLLFGLAGTNGQICAFEPGTPTVYEYAPANTTVDYGSYPNGVVGINYTLELDTDLAKYFYFNGTFLLVKPGVNITRANANPSTSNIKGDINCIRAGSSAVPTTINIRVVNINLDPPIFINPSAYTFDVDDNYPLSVNIPSTTVSAYDPDGFTNFVYAIESQTPEAAFALSSTSTATFQLSNPLDYNTHQTYTLNVSATSIGIDNVGKELTQTSYAEVIFNVVNKDNNPPVFLPCPKGNAICPPPLYQVVVAPGSTELNFLEVNGQPVSNIEARDGDQLPDTTISFRFVTGLPSNYTEYFTIDPSTGNVAMTKPCDINGQVFTMQIEAKENTDAGRTSYTSLTVEVKQNDTAPPEITAPNSGVGYLQEVSTGFAFVTEDEAGTKAFLLTVSDPDNPDDPNPEFAYMATNSFQVSQDGYVYKTPQSRATFATPETVKITAINLKAPPSSPYRETTISISVTVTAVATTPEPTTEVTSEATTDATTYMSTAEPTTATTTVEPTTPSAETTGAPTTCPPCEFTTMPTEAPSTAEAITCPTVETPTMCPTCDPCTETTQEAVTCPTIESATECPTCDPCLGTTQGATTPNPFVSTVGVTKTECPTCEPCTETTQAISATTQEPITCPTATECPTCETSTDSTKGSVESTPEPITCPTPTECPTCSACTETTQGSSVASSEAVTGKDAINCPTCEPCTQTTQAPIDEVTMSNANCPTTVECPTCETVSTATDGGVGNNVPPGGVDESTLYAVAGSLGAALAICLIIIAYLVYKSKSRGEPKKELLESESTTANPSPSVSHHTNDAFEDVDEIGEPPETKEEPMEETNFDVEPDSHSQLNEVVVEDNQSQQHEDEGYSFSNDTHEGAAGLFAAGVAGAAIYSAMENGEDSVSHNSVEREPSELDVPVVPVVPVPLPLTDENGEVLVQDYGTAYAKGEVTVDEIIKDGSYGQTKLVTIQKYGIEQKSTKAVVKTLNLKVAETIDRSSYEARIRLMREASAQEHSNILPFCGSHTDENEIHYALLHTENGNLSDYMTSRGANALEPAEMISVIHGIGQGLQYLHSKNIVHCHLQAKWVMLDENKTPMIYDYENNEISQVEDSEERKRWQAVEVLDGDLSTKSSDVWSFGVVMWEVASRGATPYADVSTSKLLEHIKDNNRLQNPGCSESMFSIMESCWNADQRMRPDMYVLTGNLAEKLIEDATELIGMDVGSSSGNLYPSLDLDSEDFTAF